MRLLLACSIAVSICAAGALAQTAPTIATRQVGTATLESVPEIPATYRGRAALSELLRRLLPGRLADGSMLITTRFGASQQVHRATAPGVHARN